MFNNPFLKKDPLLEAVKSAQTEGNLRRQAEAVVNEAFGVYSRKAVIREQLSAYDTALEEAYKCMKEGEKWEGSKEDRDEDAKLAKKHGMTMKQWEKSAADKKHDAKEKMDEAKNEKKEKEDKPKSDYSKMREKMVGKGKDLETTRKIVGEAKKLADKDYDKDGKVESPKDEVWGSRLRAAKMAGKLKEGAMDAGSYEGSKSVTKSAPKEDPSTPKVPYSELPKTQNRAGAVIDSAKGALKEAKYSAKAARAGADIGKPGKNFAKIAKKAGERYGSEERGKKVAGAILAKIRAKHMKEDSSFNTAQVVKTKKLGLGKTVREQVVDAAPPPAFHQPAPVRPGMKQTTNLRAPTGFQGARQITNPVKPNVNIGNITKSVQQGMSQAGRQAASMRATVPQPPVTAGARAGVGGIENAASKALSATARTVGKVAGGALGSYFGMTSPAGENKSEFQRQSDVAKGISYKASGRSVSDYEKQVLTPKASKPAEPKPAAVPADTPEKTSTGMQGNNLRSTISNIAQANKIKDVNKIYTGKTIDVGGGDKYTVQKGDNLTKIAKGFYGSGSKSTPSTESATKPAETSTPTQNPAPKPMMTNFEPSAPQAGNIPKMSDQPPDMKKKAIKEEVSVGSNKYRIV